MWVIPVGFMLFFLKDCWPISVCLWLWKGYELCELIKDHNRSQRAQKARSEAYKNSDQYLKDWAAHQNYLNEHGIHSQKKDLTYYALKNNKKK